jgi:hypothetical protein
MKMKKETKINALAKLLASQETAQVAIRKQAFASTAVCDLWRKPEDVAKIAIDAQAAAKARVDADAIFRALKKPVREWAKVTKAWAESQGLAGASLGGEYSGRTRTEVRWGAETSASTATSYGDRYSRSCKYSKLDACHAVTLCAEDIVRLEMYKSVAESSGRDGLPVIGAREWGMFVWVRARAKAISLEQGWIAYKSGTCYHSQKSHEDAVAGLERKIKALERDAWAKKHGRAIERRARLVARLCGGICATVKDAERMGYCAAGIAAFRERHGIGETATLPQLVRTGNVDAVRLALSIARKVSASKQAEKTA